MQAYLIAVTSLTGGMERFLRDRELTWTKDDSVSDAERTVEASGRICYMSFGELQHRLTTGDYLANIISQGHDSVLEHANFTVLIDGVSRSLSHQLVRHRVGFSYSQLSQQYHDESEADFVQPAWLENDSELLKQWTVWVESTRMMYQALLESANRIDSADNLKPKERQRLARSMARSVLPNATETTLVITGNARAWRNLLRMRGGIKGDLEMRCYCVAVYRLLYESAPHLFSGFEVMDDPLGSFLRA